MARNPASPLRLARMACAVGVWAVVVGVTQGALCADLGDALRRMENSIELRLRPPAMMQQAPGHITEPDSIEPWELVSV